MFSYTEHAIDLAPLAMRYYLAPWDRPFFPGNTAAISAITIRLPEQASDAFGAFRRWCKDEDVCLVSCRLPQDRLSECGFLEAQGFRFIELNYRPVCNDLSGYTPDPDIVIAPAAADEKGRISAIASTIFSTGRLHLDPQVGTAIGDRRYAAWVDNAFRNPQQTVLALRLNRQLAGFVVVEKPESHRRFWSLIGLAPGLEGQGLGRRIWRTLLASHASDGVTEVATSISSQNPRVFNLYVGLGFRFPAPEITLHWCPGGPLRQSGL